MGVVKGGKKIKDGIYFFHSISDDISGVGNGADGGAQEDKAFGRRARDAAAQRVEV